VSGIDYSLRRDGIGKVEFPVGHHHAVYRDTAGIQHVIQGSGESTGYLVVDGIQGSHGVNSRSAAGAASLPVESVVHIVIGDIGYYGIRVDRNIHLDRQTDDNLEGVSIGLGGYHSGQGVSTQAGGEEAVRILSLRLKAGIMDTNRDST